MTLTDDRFDAAVAEIDARRADDAARAELWLAHHWPDDYERCVEIRGRHVCRRCLALYGTSFAVAIVLLAGVPLWPESLDLWIIWGLCIPATVDFVGEQTGMIRYSARRQLITTMMLGPALGAGIAHELRDSWSWEFWGPVLVFCTLWFGAALEGRRRSAETGTV